jgi:cobyrinic acid a,c-diamide synthase
MPPRLVIAAPHSGAGKTTVTSVLAAAFSAQGLRVQPFKVGPDFIDPTHLQAAAGTQARTLDGFFLTPSALQEAFAWGAREADLTLIEGVMGLFDGKDPLGTTGSTAQVAKLLKAPVILVVDAGAMAGSIAALARGFRDHDPDLRLGGVIANHVGSEGHAIILREALDSIGLPLLGYLPTGAQLELPSRHLGLIMAGEHPLDRQAYMAAAAHLNLRQILDIASKAPRLRNKPGTRQAPRKQARARIALAWDNAFNFYYPENLEGLEQCGAELVPFSPLADEALPPRVGALYLGGGYPELHAARLAGNTKMLNAVRAFQGNIYAECGGLMYLSDGLETPEGHFPMVGLVPGTSVMQDQPTIGYRQVQALEPSLLAAAGWTLKGHEFHYSTRPSGHKPAYRRCDGDETEGFNDGRVLASYIHLYFPSTPDVAKRFVDHAATTGG